MCRGCRSIHGLLASGTAWEASAQTKTKSCFWGQGGKTELGTCCRYLECSSSPNAEGNGWRKEGKEGIYSLTSRSLWTISSADLTWEWLPLEWSYSELRIWPTLCVYCLILGKGKCLQLFSAKQLNQRKISPLLLLPGNSLLLKSRLQSLFSEDHLTDPLQ